jgi:hypothetical protein
MPPAKRIDVDQRAEGLRLWREGMIYLRFQDRRAEQALRGALAYLVDAFLEDRKANARLFTLCHRIGCIIEENFGCAFAHDEETDRFTHDCPIQALHSRVGLSVALISMHRCSICGAGDFECDHEPGQSYDGVECTLEHVSTWLDHVALTQDPDFAYTFHLDVPKSRKEIEEMVGRPMKDGESVLSTHCRDCYGRYFAHADDLDTSLWEGLSTEEAAMEDELAAATTTDGT